MPEGSAFEDLESFEDLMVQIAREGVKKERRRPR
jgi:hypothetical protein